MVDSLRVLSSSPAPEMVPQPSFAAPCRVVDSKGIDHVANAEVEIKGVMAATSSSRAASAVLATSDDSRNLRLKRVQSPDEL